MTTQKDYIARAAGWVAGQRVAAGDRITLSPAEARYENVEPAGDVERAEDGGRGKRRRKVEAIPAGAGQGEAGA
ncbi:hypothetical protein [Paracoccus sp. (in: a-proteobacteria)]|uniref:hypothetical protein n=1 Tax=Paracoccus sp. TaxID=267 RepID=UPI002AFE7CBA|nr:hypothetical protein [Paracoccus sp. (in: a-proteobacteria)]